MKPEIRDVWVDTKDTAQRPEVEVMWVSPHRVCYRRRGVKASTTMELERFVERFRLVTRVISR